MKNVIAVFGVLIVLGFVITFWAWIVAAAIIAGLVWAAYAFGVPWWQRRQARAMDWRNGETARQSGLAARAEVQNQQYLAGDAHGLYGDYQPEPLD